MNTLLAEALTLRSCWGALVEAEAAHIVPVLADGADDVRNALALCRTHHWAFDERLWTVGTSGRIVVAEAGREVGEACPPPLVGAA